MKMEAICASQVSVDFAQTARCYTSEDRTPQTGKRLRKYLTYFNTPSPHTSAEAFSKTKNVLPRTQCSCFALVVSNVFLRIKGVKLLCSDLSLSCTQCGGKGLLTVGPVNSTSTQWIEYWSVRLQPMLLGQPAAIQYYITTGLYIIPNNKGLLVNVAEERVRRNWKSTLRRVDIRENTDNKYVIK